MYRARRTPREQYTILRSRLQRKSQPVCRACRAQLMPSVAICPNCGANRKMPVTGATQRLPRLAAPISGFRRDAQPIARMLMYFLYAGVWVWLWPTPRFVLANRAADPRFFVLYYGVVTAFIATLGMIHSWKIRAAIAFGGLGMCWVIRALMM